MCDVSRAKGANVRYVQPTELISPICRTVYEWYVGLSPAGEWPPLHASHRPDDLPGRALPNLGIVDVEPAPLRVFYRVMGAAIGQSFGIDGSGKYLDELGLPQEGDIRTLYRDSLVAERPLFGCGEVDSGETPNRFEAGAMPFGSRSDRPRRFLIVEDYFDCCRYFSVMQPSS